MLYTRNHTCDLLCLASFTRHNMFEAHPSCSMNSSFLFMAKVYLSIHPDGYLGCFHLLAVVPSATMVNSVQSVFVFFLVYSQEWNAGSYGNFMHNLLSYCQTIHYSSCSILHSCQQLKVPISPHSLHNLFCFKNYIHFSACSVSLLC